MAERSALPLDDLYPEVVLDHHRHPRGRKPLSHANCTVEEFNSSCGDQLHLALDVEGGQVKEAQVECKGCSISVASGSMMAELVAGKDVAAVRRLIEAVKGLMQGKDPDSTVDLGDIEALEGVRKFPVRVKCALLCVDAAGRCPGGDPMITQDQVLDALMPVTDPEINLSVVDLGLIYGVDIREDGKAVKIEMTQTSPMCSW